VRLQVHLLSVEMVNALGLSQDAPMEGEALRAHCELWSSKVVEASRQVDEIIGQLPSKDAQQRRKEREDALVRTFTCVSSRRVYMRTA